MSEFKCKTRDHSQMKPTTKPKWDLQFKLKRTHKRMEISLNRPKGRKQRMGIESETNKTVRNQWSSRKRRHTNQLEMVENGWRTIENDKQRTNREFT